MANANRINLILDALKHRIEKNKLIEVQLEEGKVSLASFCFNPPAQETEIDLFFKSNNWHVPNDYLLFLKQHNGGTLFCDPKYGGGLSLFGLDSIMLHRNEYDYMFPQSCYPIGMLNAAMIYIDSELAKSSNEGYLYWQDCIGSHETALKLNINFETFLDLFIVAQGSEYWLWPTFKP